MSIDIHDDDHFDERNQGQTRRSKAVHEGQPVFAGAGRKQDSDQETEEAAAAWNFIG